MAKVDVYNMDGAITGSIDLSDEIFGIDAGYVRDIAGWTGIVHPDEQEAMRSYFAREVLPHVPDAWYDPESVKVGYEISFTRYFYKPLPLRTLVEIRADILALERETDGLLGEILGEES